MKKTLVVAAGLAVLSTSAFASKARVSALNQSAALGSYYMEDTRNVWRSAGAFSGNYVIIEHGTNNAIPTSEDFDNGVSATAEGGFFREGSMFNYGLYLNSTDTYGNIPSFVAGADVARADLFLASNSGMKWGVRLGYTSFNYDSGVEGANETSATGIDLSLNAELGGANVWLSFAPAGTLENGALNEDQTAQIDVETESDMRLGATYDYGDHTLFAEYASEGGPKGADAMTVLTVGAGRTMTTDSGMFFYDISYQSVSGYNHNSDLDDDGKNDDQSVTRLPVTFGFEAQATSWLQWRVSIQQSLLGSLEAASSSLSGRTTKVGAGASLTWGNLQVDGTLTGATNFAAGSTKLGSNDLMSNLSATYNF